MVLVLLAIWAATSIEVATASAAPEARISYVPVGSVGGAGTATGKFAETVTQIAVEPTSGNLLVPDPGNGRLQVFSTGPDGMPEYLENLGSGVLVKPVGVAVDNATGAIYVSDADVEKIFRFSSDGAPTPTYTLDPTFASPVLGSYASQIAVDPANHDLVVADTGVNEIRRFDTSDGHEISSFDGSSSPEGPFTALRGVAVGLDGTLYVTDESSPQSIFFGGSSRALVFDASGSYSYALEGIARAAGIGVDPATGELGVAWNNFAFELPRMVSTFKPGGSPEASVELPGDVMGGGVSLAISSLEPKYMYVLLTQFGGGFGQPQIEILKAVSAPASEVEGIDEIDSAGETAHVLGSVDPGTLSGPGTAWFEYSPDETTWAKTPEQTGIVGSGATQVSAQLINVRPNSTISVRLHVQNEGASATSPIKAFTTEPIPPRVEPTAVNLIGESGVTLNGRVNPFGLQTTYRFEYGETTAYGMTAPAGLEDVAGNGYAPRLASVDLGGLKPATTYHYRLVARNAAGITASLDQTFVTDSTGGPARAYEEVSPIAKGGAILNNFCCFQASADGDSIVYQTKNAMDLPGTAGAPQQSRYIGKRSSAGWELRQLDAPLNAVPPGEVLAQSTLAVSNDQSHALVVSNRSLAPGAVEGQGNIYRRDVETGDYELVEGGTPFLQTSGSGGATYYYGGSRNFSKIVYLSPNGVQIKEWAVGQGSHTVSILPDGTPNEGFISSGSYAWPAETLVSEDLKKLYFSVAGSAQDGAYLRSEGHTTLISESGHEAAVVGATPDGRYAAYLDQSTGELYRYDDDSGISEPIAAEVFGSNSFLGISDNGESLFWSVNGSLFAWHEGNTKTIATTLGGSFAQEGVGASPDGRYFAFASKDIELPSYDSRNATACAFKFADSTGGRCFEVYVYDTKRDVLSCASCPGNGQLSTGHAFLGPTEAPLSHHGQRFVNNNGQVFFDTPTGLISADVNGTRDVYEYQQGEVRLISPGTGPFNAQFADASADGRDVFFTSEQRLVAQDEDGEIDLYDARAGGGIPVQGLTPQGSGCTGDDCRVNGSQTPAAVAASSEMVAPSHLIKPRKRCGKGSTSRKVNGKVVCVRKQKKGGKHRAHANRGTHR